MCGRYGDVVSVDGCFECGVSGKWNVSHVYVEEEGGENPALWNA